jgi:hypothetical protein
VDGRAPDAGKDCEYIEEGRIGLEEGCDDANDDTCCDDGGELVIEDGCDEAIPGMEEGLEESWGEL